MYKINFFYIAPPPAFDFEEQFNYAGGWPGVFENVNYDWNPADGEESLATPDFQENFDNCRKSNAKNIKLEA